MWSASLLMLPCWLVGASGLAREGPLQALRAGGGAAASTSWSCCDLAGSDGTDEQRCEAGNLQAANATYVYNNGRKGGEPGVCGLGCSCCVRPRRQPRQAPLPNCSYSRILRATPEL